jgi:hypothetical protein
MKKPPVRKVREVQNWLFDYLDIDLDPYDFTRELQAWAEAEEVSADWKGNPIDRDTTPHELTDRQRKAFKEWLIDHEKGIEWVSTGDIYAPAYLYFNEVKKLPAGTWCVHFSEQSFDVFESGTTLEGLALSTHKKTKDIVDCKKNLGPDIGTFEVVFGFAFEADTRDVGWRGQKYGNHAVLFKTDGGVRAWHIGDEEDQVIFPLCSEYDVIPLGEIGGGVIVCNYEGADGEGLQFDTIQALIRYIEVEEKAGHRPIQRLKC